jgi:hypothetical protein
MTKIFLLLLLVSTTQLFAQLPQTQIYILPMQHDTMRHKFNFGEMQRVSKKKGYNNQPSFSPDSKSIYYVTFMDSTNTDIVNYNLKKKELKQITNTKANEYSPMVTPDGKYISCVKGEAQQVWKYKISDPTRCVRVIKDFDSVGYYVWMNKNTIVSNVLPAPFALYANVLSNDTNIKFYTGIGRCLQSLKNENTVFYVQKKDSVNWYINALELNDNEPPHLYYITKSIPGEEDFTILNDGTILMFSKKNLYKYNIIRDLRWSLLQSFDDAPVDGFYRIAVSPDQKSLAIVGYKGVKP